MIVLCNIFLLCEVSSCDWGAKNPLLCIVRIEVIPLLVLNMTGTRNKSHVKNSIHIALDEEDKAVMS
jgi:hypothetical protein